MPFDPDLFEVPILAPSNTWYKSSVARNTITEINIVNSYTPTGNENESWNADVDNSGAIKCYRTGTVITIAGNGSGMIKMNEDSSFMFSNNRHILDNATLLFSSCASINGLNLLDSSAVTTMQQIFGYCISLTELDLSSWDVSNVTTFRFAFGANESVGTMALTTLNLTGWNITNKCTSLLAMFQYCSNLTAIDTSNWDVSNVTEMSYLFHSCFSIESLDVSKWDTGKVTDMKSMFCKCTSLKSLDVSNWDVSNVTDMSYMFSRCFALESLDVSKWDTGKVTTMYAMFQMDTYGMNHPPFTQLDTSNWNTSSVIDMGWMFYGLVNVRSHDVSKWDVSKVVSFHHMFAHTYTTVTGYENWDLSSCKTLNAIFLSCNNTEFDVSKWDVSGVENFGQMFEIAQYLKRIKGLENWDTSSGKTFYEMFRSCKSLTELDLSSFDTRNADDTWVDPYRDAVVPGGMADMFGAENSDGTNSTVVVSALQKIKLGKNFSANGNGNCRPARLPAPNFGIHEDEDGHWYSSIDFEPYLPEEIPSLTAATYYSSPVYIDAEGRVEYNKLYNIGKAIRKKTGRTDKIKIDDMPLAIEDSSGGEQATPVIDINNSTGLITATAGTKSSTYQLAFQPAKTITPSTTSQVAVSANYYTGGDIIVAAVPTQTKNVTPTREEREVFPDEGKFLSSVNIDGDVNLVAENIKSGVSIFGVNGTLVEGSGSGDSAEWSENEDAIVRRTITNYTNDRVESIGDYAFIHCTKLISVNFPICTYIGSNAFNGCNNLTTVNFPVCTIIGNSAFAYCYSLSSLTLGASTVCILSNSNAFTATPYTGHSNYFSGTPYIYVPASLIDAYKSATNWIYFSSYFSSIESLGGNLITFTINGTAYQAEEGMTWEEWVNSKYNTIGAYISSIYVIALSVPLEYGNEYVLSLDHIVNGASYIAKNGGGAG